MIDPVYVLFSERSYDEPEEKLARAIVEDWFSSMWRLVKKIRAGKPLSKKELVLWKENVEWPYSYNAYFWVEEVLGGNVSMLKLLLDDLLRVSRGENPVYFTSLLNLLNETNGSKDEKSEKGRKSR